MHGVLLFITIFCGIFGAVQALRLLYCAAVGQFSKRKNKGGEHNGTGGKPSA